MSNILPPSIFSQQEASIMGAITPPIGGNDTGGGNVAKDQVLALLTATILQMGVMLADAMKSNIKYSKDNNDFTTGVKVEAPCLKDDHCAKVLEHIQLVISTTTLRGFGYAFKPSMVTLLPEKCSDIEMLDLSDDDEFKKYKAVQANDNAIVCLRMAFPSPKHQHEIDASFTTGYPQGLVHEAIRGLKAQVIPSRETTVTVLQMELNIINMQETDDLQTINDKFNG